MAGDSDQLVRKAKELDEWLTELESQLKKVGPLVILFRPCFNILKYRYI
jgi:hypothetical protein